MTVILGIDAAWTDHEPSGVAIVAKDADRWHVVRVAPSYETFLASASGSPICWESRLRGSTPDVPRLLATARSLTAQDVSVVVLDMPISTVPFSTRRAADRAISKTFGGRGCSTHSPSAERPGRLSSFFMSQLRDAGFPLATASQDSGTYPSTVEAYPHPALLHLLDRSYRLPYKVSRSRRYWPGLDTRQRIARLLAEFHVINGAFNATLGDTGLRLPASDDVPSLSALKSYEDAIDALVCAWVGIRFVEKAATPYGDETAAIWVPTETT